jgi:translation initiation factor 4B
MSFDTTEGEVSEFFKDCQVTKVRIVEDKMDRKPKGFGYVEFATLDGLKKALSYAGTSLAGRTIRVSVADPRKPSSLYHSASGTFANPMSSEGQAGWTRF